MKTGQAAVVSMQLQTSTCGLELLGVGVDSIRGEGAYIA